MPTRTIGDLDCKQALGEIVSPHPEIKLAAIYAPPEEGRSSVVSRIFRHHTNPLGAGIA